MLMSSRKVYFFSYVNADICCEKLYVPQFAIAVLCHLIKW